MHGCATWAVAQGCMLRMALCFVTLNLNSCFMGESNERVELVVSSGYLHITHVPSHPLLPHRHIVYMRVNSGRPKVPGSSVRFGV